MNSLYAVQIPKDKNEFRKCKSHSWMETEYDNIVLDYWKLPNEIYIVNLGRDDGLDGGIYLKKHIPKLSRSFYFKL